MHEEKIGTLMYIANLETSYVVRRSRAGKDGVLAVWNVDAAQGFYRSMM